ncbi:hypothetical protein G3A43_06180 [Paraburkholderia aspalathi]|nr:hypothetical protein [Paraburkholderia aspalathi]MBK3779835.1 hypothetical protein [Paraburkholderia aspalathi]
MGTSVYMGFKLQTGGFGEALRIANAFRPWVTAQAEAVMDAFMERAEASKKTPVADAYELWQNLRSKFVREKRCRVPGVDTDFSITLIPAGDFVLGIAFTEHRAWFDAWCQQPGVEEYAYWSGGDAPEHLPDAEWTARAAAWDVLSCEPVCLQGFSIDLVDPEGPWPKQFRV